MRTGPADGGKIAAKTAAPKRKPVFVAERRVTIAQQAYQYLRREIVDGRLVPRAALSEADLSASLGVSRTPVREALFRLRTEGYLEVEPKTGWYVRPIDFDSVDQLYELRIVLETASVVRLAARAADPPELEALKAVWLVPAAERLSDGHAVGALDEQFHATLVRATGNAEMTRVHQDVTERIRIVRRLDFTRSDRIEATYQEHAKILRAVMQRKAEQAQLLLKSHIEQSRLEVRKITLHGLHQARARRVVA